MPCETAQASLSSGTRRIQSTLAGPRKEAGLGVPEPSPGRRHQSSCPEAHPTTEILCPRPQPLRFSHRTWSWRATSPRGEGPLQAKGCIPSMFLFLDLIQAPPHIGWCPCIFLPRSLRGFRRKRPYFGLLLHHLKVMNSKFVL